ncbi:ABC transporter ATP-binding protein [Pinibacter aurantiacus]|uniref:ABC transporter ATP-binding protein n=1 Tax=Pinibacter aurantiacus TaxID=2851599 RepID=A0A9E2S6J5_9BACT|nr:ABC transporter ATP-binding protein [Pinibacter aurantiacus]MBV4355912.1 ABC transporter ATP-binding protein [Pinibacter aurantiacus]
MIEVTNLSFGYKKRKPLYNNLTLQLPVGSIYGLLGKNGAGKSTLLKNFTGLLFPKSGTLQVNGFDPKKRLPSFLQTIYFIPEEVYVPSLTAEGYKKLFAPFYPLFNEEQFYHYLDFLDVHDKGKLSTLSFGQQKKFVIAFALACNTKILLLDEPTNGLDIPSKIKFRKLISSVFTDDKMIFISTHQIRDLENLIDNVIIVDNGELLMQASLTEIAQKLSFKMVDTIDNESAVLYSEPSLKGHAIVTENTTGDESKVNLEFLFNAITGNPEKSKVIFKTK